MNEGTPLAKANAVMVEVTAPATLKEGYTFQAAYDGQLFVVIVPAGGVTEGQVFKTLHTPGVSSSAPNGRWVDGLCNCCSNFPSCLMACCCSICLLGQILTRLKLTWSGSSATGNEHLNTFRNVVLVGVVYFVLTSVLNPVPTEDELKNGTYSYQPSVMGQIVNIVFGLYVLVLLIRARYLTRVKYSISEKHCTGCEDCMCAFCCQCCTLAQIARQTGDYDVNEFACCTKNGLKNDEAVIV